MKTGLEWVVQVPGKKGFSVKSVLVWFAILGMVGFLGWRIAGAVASKRASVNPGASQRAAARWGGGRSDLVTVRVQPVSRRTVEEVSVLSGTLEPAFQVDVVARRAGRLASAKAEVGQRVEAGQILGTVEHEDLLLQERQMQANLAANQASLRKAEIQREKVWNDYQRVEQLYEKKAAAEQELKNVKNQLREADVQLELSRAQMAQVEASSAMLKLQLAQTQIDSPVSGVLISSSLTVGRQVNTSTPLATVAGVDPIQVVFHVPEREVGRIVVGQPLTVSVDAFPNEKFGAKVTGLGATIDPSTRSLEVKALVANPDLRLRSGMFAKVDLIVDRDEQAVTIPREALMTGSDGFYVFVAGQDRVARRLVQVGVQGREHVSIKSGLQEGELVVVVGQQGLRDGQTVRTVGVEDAADAPAGPPAGAPQGRRPGGGSRP